MTRLEMEREEIEGRMGRTEKESSRSRGLVIMNLAG